MPSSIGEIGRVSTFSSYDNTDRITVPRTIPEGRLIVVFVTLRDALQSTVDAQTVTDAKGNTYTRLITDNFGDTIGAPIARNNLFACNVTTELLSADWIDLNVGTSDTDGGIAWEFDDVTLATFTKQVDLDLNPDLTDPDVGTPVMGQSLTSMTVPTDVLAIGMFGSQSLERAHAITVESGDGWTEITPLHQSQYGTPSIFFDDMWLTPVYRITTAEDTFNYACTSSARLYSINGYWGYFSSNSTGVVDSVLDRHRLRKYVFRESGTSVVLDTNYINSAGRFGNTLTTSIDSSSVSPAISRLPSGSVSLSYSKSSSVKFRLYNPFSGTTVAQTIGSGTLADHVIDHKGRFVFAVYNSGWFIRVGTLQADGRTLTVSGAVSMGLGTTAAVKGSLEVLPDDAISFTYVNNSSQTVIRVCKNLSNAGVGTWA
jgi:hypothetical protein